jgi:hypothetical protein
MAQLDENKLHEFVGKMLGDLGGAFSVLFDGASSL